MKTSDFGGARHLVVDFVLVGGKWKDGRPSIPPGFLKTACGRVFGGAHEVGDVDCPDCFVTPAYDLAEMEDEMS